MVEPNPLHHTVPKGPYGIRTRAAAVRGRCPRPLDEWAVWRGHGSERPTCQPLDGDLAEERRGVERVVAEAGGDLLARELRPLAEEIGEQLAGLRVAPPVLVDGVDQVPTQLRRANPRAQVIGRVEARVHVGEVAVAAVADP